MKNILIVEDEELLCKIYATSLSDSGYNIRIANDANTALEKLKEYQADLIMLDVKLPGMSGLELLKKIREIDQDVHIIMVSAYDSFKSEYEVWASQISDYIVKPVKLAELLTKIKNILGE